MAQSSEGPADGPRDRPALPNREAAAFKLPLVGQIFSWLLLAVAVAVAVLLALWLTFGGPAVSAIAPPELTPATLFEAMKIALACVAGIGGVVALTVAYRRQRLNELENKRNDDAADRDQTRLFSERFSRAADQLGSDRVAVRLAGCYAISQLADDWEKGRQTCIDVLCAYLRTPYIPVTKIPDLEFGHGDQRAALTVSTIREAQSSPSKPGVLAYPTDEEYQVRGTILRQIRDHLLPDAEANWFGAQFNLSGAVIESAAFDRANFIECDIDFSSCLFLGECSFAESVFADSSAWFLGAVVADRVGFEFATFRQSQMTLYFSDSSPGEVNLQGCVVESGNVEIIGCQTSFVSSDLRGGTIEITRPPLGDQGSVAFSRSHLTGAKVVIRIEELARGNIWCNGLTISDGEFVITSLPPHDVNYEVRPGTIDGTEIAFNDLQLTGGQLRLENYNLVAGTIKINGLEMSGGTIDLSSVRLKGGRVELNGWDVSGGELRIGELRHLVVPVHPGDEQPPAI